jgi:hypothetical protein
LLPASVSTFPCRGRLLTSAILAADRRHSAAGRSGAASHRRFLGNAMGAYNLTCDSTRSLDLCDRQPTSPQVQLVAGFGTAAGATGRCCNWRRFADGGAPENPDLLVAINLMYEALSIAVRWLGSPRISRRAGKRASTTFRSWPICGR